MPTTATGSPPTPAQAPTPKTGFRADARHFWERVTDGLELAQLWAQFRADAASSYRFYSFDLAPAEGGSRFRRFLNTAKAFFWAVMSKLSPARRVILLASLLLLLLPNFVANAGNEANPSTFHFYAGLGLLLLLLLEVADRVTMKRDLEIAREIQLWLVPENPPQVPGLDMAFYNRPANTVAGDYYDVFPRTIEENGKTRNTVLLAVADVAGKSLPAALLMATFQASLKTLSASSVPLLELAAGLNRYACAHSRNGARFTTAFLAEYDPESRQIAYVNAGHNTPVLRRANGTIERLDRGGLPFGIMADGTYDSGTLTLQTGDLVLIYTDGLIEAVNERDEEFGETRMLASLQAHASVAAKDMLFAIMSDVQIFVGMTHQHDDITCLLLRAI